VVLVNENKCRAWRMCVAACPYKKVYYNWSTGKSEKCILCFPRLETGQAPACAHSCVGRIRYMGVLLYDAERIPETAAVPDDRLIEAQGDIILDPSDPEVIEAARAAGIDDGWMDAARRSPVYRFVKEWKIALPLHTEYRTIPLMYYVPPLSPIVATVEQALIRLDLPDEEVDFELFHELDKARLPIAYLAKLFAAGDEQVIRRILRKMLAVRLYKRRQSISGEVDETTLRLVEEAGTSVTEIEATYRLTTLAKLAERFVLPPYNREVSIESLQDPLAHKGEVGFGYMRPPRRGS
jgi:nitrate reductase beta subunit